VRTIGQLTGVLVACLSLTACGVPGQVRYGHTVTAGTTGPAAGPTRAPSRSATGSCTWRRTEPGPDVRDVGVPPAAAGTQTTMSIATSQGTISVRLDPSAAPCTVASFAYLAGKHYFDGTACHRLVTSGIYVLQCGDPSGTGSGGPAYAFDDENLGATSGTYPAGTVAMANAGPGTNGSQFFVVYKDSPLQPDYTPFGQVTGGLDAVTAVAAQGTADGSGDGHPKVPVTIKTLSVS
jgi:peptidyl-prolyl cis-trans isomerase B (cyclophilin B)